MAGTIIGPHTWSGGRDADGDREYKIKHRVRMDSTLDGPATALETPGLPVPGSPWIFDNDIDLWAWCRNDATITPVVSDGDPNRFFDIEQTFSTKPPSTGGGPGSGGEVASCAQGRVDDPLLQPMKISGSFVKYTEEATHDLHGPIHNSAWEQIRGPQVEFDRNRPQVRIEQNVAVLELDLASRMVDSLNDSALWGLPPRCVKLSDVSWERKFYGQCNVYYTRHLTFDIRFDSFDRVLLDEGTKVLNGHYDDETGEYVLDPIPPEALNPNALDVQDPTKPPNPNPSNPSHFIRYKDRLGENSRVVLDGHGKPYEKPDASFITLTPATQCGDAADPLFVDGKIIPNQTYGPISAGGFSHYYQVKGSKRPRRVIITSDAVNLEGVVVEVALENGLTEISFQEGQFTIDFFDANCVAARPDMVSDPMTVGNQLFKTGTVETENMVIRIGLLANGMTYNIRVEGTDPDNSPGKVLVQKYPSANLYLLGIPATF